MNISEVRKLLGISNSWIAKAFGYKNVNSYNRSSGKPKIEKGIIELYSKFKEDERKPEV